jgi:hypothetical protein
MNSTELTVLFAGLILIVMSAIGLLAGRSIFANCICGHQYSLHAFRGGRCVYCSCKKFA